MKMDILVGENIVGQLEVDYVGYNSHIGEYLEDIGEKEENQILNINYRNNLSNLVRLTNDKLVIIMSGYKIREENLNDFIELIEKM